jgi:hypothetical protein
MQKLERFLIRKKWCDVVSSAKTKRIDEPSISAHLQLCDWEDVGSMFLGGDSGLHVSITIWAWNFSTETSVSHHDPPHLFTLLTEL